MALKRLYRAVDQIEFNDIIKVDQYRLGRGNEVKYFYPKRKQMLTMIPNFQRFYKTNYYKTSGAFSAQLPASIQIAGEGPAFVLDKGHLPHGPVKKK